MERLQKIIANRGYCSRRDAEELILQGKVTVDGQIIQELGFKTSPNADVKIDGKSLEKEDLVYYLLYKPKSVISSVKDDRGRTTVVDLIDEERKIFPVGRLDYDTTGLILLTNDGQLNQNLTHPKNEIEKKYLAKVKGKLNNEDLKKLRTGVIIDNYKTAPAKVKLKSYTNGKSLVEISIHEGKNQQVKKMFASLGKELLKLKREELAFLDLKGIPIGKYRKLKIKEVKKLYALTNKNS